MTAFQNTGLPFLTEEKGLYYRSQDTHDCNCVALKQKKSCNDLHEKAKFDCLTKPAAAHVLEQCPKKKISF